MEIEEGGGGRSSLPDLELEQEQERETPLYIVTNYSTNVSNACMCTIWISRSRPIPYESTR